MVQDTRARPGCRRGKDRATERGCAGCRLCRNLCATPSALVRTLTCAWSSRVGDPLHVVPLSRRSSRPGDFRQTRGDQVLLPPRAARRGASMVGLELWMDGDGAAVVRPQRTLLLENTQILRIALDTSAASPVSAMRTRLGVHQRPESAAAFPRRTRGFSARSVIGPAPGWRQSRSVKPGSRKCSAVSWTITGPGRSVQQLEPPAGIHRTAPAAAYPPSTRPCVHPDDARVEQVDRSVRIRSC